jgi:hypothetical protein
VTTVAFRDGILASDSRYTDINVGITSGPKLFKKQVGKKQHLIGICGAVYSAMLFVDWYGTDKSDLHKQLTGLNNDEFEVMVWDGKVLRAANYLLRLTEVHEPYFAIGSGAVHAITAMDCGKSAMEAVQMAARRDSGTGGKVVTMTLLPKEIKK